MESSQRRMVWLGSWLMGYIAVASWATAQPPSTDIEANVSPTFITPPAPILRPSEAIETIRLVPGYHLELVAADPLIQDPIAITFDPDGRIWVCEMRGFMPNIDGFGEDAPIGVISVLDDTDGDGLMDHSTVFQDGLVLPRGLCWTPDGVLVCENGTIWLCRDLDNDDRCDQREVVCTYTRGNLEHSLNGLMPALDNCIYNAKEGIRLQRIDGRWIPDRIDGRGQWGITQDNVGRLFYNVNASLLRGDLVPCYSPVARSDNALVDVQLYDDQTMYPIRPTPGINRGYLPDFLRPDGSLIEANSNCGPVVYRGNNLPEELIGDVFIPDPAGNLIRRQRLVSVDGKTTSVNAYDEKEFLASTDERFRPVNMFNAPDGTLYIVDMYRGIIQHGAFITPYLREQIEQRDLDQGINLGRIYRIVHESSQRRPIEKLSHLSNAELVPFLSHSNGWHRDMAQQLLVQRGDPAIVPEIERLVIEGTSALGRLHAIWTLEGLGRLDPELLYECLSDSDPHVRASAVTLHRRFLSNQVLANTMVDDLLQIADDPDPLVQLELVQALGFASTQEVDRALQAILRSTATNSSWIDGMIGGFAGQESEFLAIRLHQASWDQSEPWRQTVLATVAGVMWRRRDPSATLRFCELLDSIPPTRTWQLIALLEGIKDPTVAPRRRFAPAPGTSAPANPAPVNSAQANSPTANSAREEPSSASSRGTNEAAAVAQSQSDSNRPPTAPPRRSMFGRPPTLRLEVVPAALDRLRESSDERVAAAAQAFADKLIWPGKDGKPLPVKPELSESQQQLFAIGRDIYANLCAGCHHPTGYGASAKGPPLLGSEWLDHESRLIQVVLDGLQGPITVHGETYNVDNRLSMPGLKASLNDEQIAGVLTYVRREFTDDAPPVETSTVEKHRHEERRDLWTEAELIQQEEQ